MKKLNIQGKNYRETVMNITEIAIRAIEDNDFKTIKKLVDEVSKIYQKWIYGSKFTEVDEWVYFVYEYLNSKVNGVKNTGYDLYGIMYYYSAWFNDIIFINKNNKVNTDKK